MQGYVAASAYMAALDDNPAVASVHCNRGNRACTVVIASRVDRTVEGVHANIGQLDQWEYAQAHRIAVEATEGVDVRITNRRAHHHASICGDRKWVQVAV